MKNFSNKESLFLHMQGRDFYLIAKDFSLKIIT